MAELKACVVCGEASHRDSWKNVAKDKNGNEVAVACDHHSTAEVAEAVKKMPKA